MGVACFFCVNNLKYPYKQTERKCIMSKEFLKNQPLPDFTRGEEIFNMITHIVGGGMGIIMLALAVIVAVLSGNPWSVVGAAIYGGALVIMFSISSIYHGLLPGVGKKVMRIIDHCDIYFLIAGTYTPILLVSIRPQYPFVAWGIFALEWGFAALAVTLNALDMIRYKKFSMACYIGMGWGIVLALKQTLICMGTAGFVWLLAGGIAYTLGALLFSFGTKVRYLHSVFHIFVNIASVLQFVAIVCYVL